MKDLLYKNIYFAACPPCVEPRDPAPGSSVSLRLFVGKAAAGLIDEIFVRMTCDNEERRIKMKKSRADYGEFYCFTAKIPLLVKTTGVRFKIYSKNNIYWLNARGVYAYHPNDYFDFRIIAGNDAPAWVNKSVFYQIFPDRFWHGLSPEEYAAREKQEKKFERLYGGREVYFRGIEPRLKCWHEPPDKKALGYEFYMGTLNGIARRKDYLRELGVNAIYLTPIFKSPTNHRYDTIDYFRVDPLLGGNSGFEKFMGEMRGANMRVIVDAVFNHSGFSCDMFKKAKKGIKPYDEFYSFYGKGRARYACWLGHGSLPKLNYASEKLRELIFRGPKSAAARWLSPPYAIDGYRLDVAHMIGKNSTSEGNAEILAEMRSAFKKHRPDAFVLAENFFDPYRMIENDCVDSVMNYHGFTFPVIAYLSGKDHGGRPNALTSAEFCDWIMDSYAKLPQARADIMYNQLSSHDISRHNSLLGKDYKKISAALVFQFTLPGVPSIFYGDEIGLTGVGDPACRAAMIWDEKRHDAALLGAYKKLVAARKKYDALAYGGFRIIRAENGVICYIRKHIKETALCVVNTSTNDAVLRLEPADMFMTGAIGRVEPIFDSTEFERPPARNKGEKGFAVNEIKAAGGALEMRVRQNSSLAVYIREER